MKLLSLFSGIGAFEKALDRLEINYELVGYCEIDKYASKAYSAIHQVPESLNIGDITKVNEKELPKDINLICYGFPCQDISLAGKQKGLFNEDGSTTRSGLFFEALRIINETQPEIAIAENVKNLTSKKFSEQFKIVLDSLDQAGYNNYWQVLNSKNYGIPQNRERVFIVSIRKDVDNKNFKFPEGFPLQLRLKDLCEAVVDEKYFLSDAHISKIQKSNFAQEATRIQNDDVCQTLLARDYKDPKCVEIEIERTSKDGMPILTHVQMETDEIKESATKLGNVYSDEYQGCDFGGTVWDKNGLAPTLKTTSAASQQFVIVDEEQPKRLFGIYDKEVVDDEGKAHIKKHQLGSVYDANNISPTLDTSQGGSRQPMILVKEATKKGYAEAYEGDSINLEQPNSKTRRGRVGHQVAQTLTTSCNQAVAVTEPNVLVPKRTEYGKAIRKAYEAGEVSESRHNMTELVPRTDGIANTLTTVLKDNILVEPIVDEPVCLNSKGGRSGIEGLQPSLQDRIYDSNAIAPALTTGFRPSYAVYEPNPIKIGNTSPSGKSQCNDVYSIDGISPTVMAGTHGNCNPSFAVPSVNEEGNPGLRIRKLTPKEYYRLQDFDDEDFERASKVVSNTQLYKQAGNSITVAVAYYLFKALQNANLLFTEGKNKQMELKMNDYQLPEKILFNYEELKQELTEKVQIYETLVYSDDQVKEAKADRANLNKLKNALKDERIRREKEYMVPFNDFKDKINEIIGIIDKPIAVIDQQVKAYEDKLKKEKEKDIVDYFESISKPDWLSLTQIFDSKWLNSSTSMKSIQDEITNKLDQVNKDLTTLSNLPQFGFEAQAVYKNSLNMNQAISEAQKMAQIAKDKAEAEARKAEFEATQAARLAQKVAEEAEAPKVAEAPLKQWISFSALLSTEDAIALKAFFNSRNIEFKAV